MSKIYSKISNKISDFHESLHVLAQNLTKEQYTLVAGTMFQLSMGERFGYLGSMDGRMLQDIRYIYDLNKKKSLKRKAKILKLKIIKGSK
jgi:hypothetical protein|tara:strand:+ start:234 stop:503 length:270 start_codon:yes stop_codon:yes gene_type:complete